jgi:hypothetical protein
VLPVVGAGDCYRSHDHDKGSGDHDGLTKSSGVNISTARDLLGATWLR